MRPSPSPSPSPFPSPRRRRAGAALLIAGAVGVALAAYLGTGAWLLHADLARLLFNAGTAPQDSVAEAGLASAFELKGAHGALMRVRHADGARGTGGADAGCVVYFPDEDGANPAATRALFDGLRQAGLSVYAVAYPGRHGGAGRADIAEVMALATQAVAMTAASCGAARTVVAGQALGGLLAAQAATTTHPAGVVLASASPSLAAAVRAHLRGHWLLGPLAWLPVERLVERDVALVDVIPTDLHVVVFQGDADDRATIAELWPDDSQPAQPPIVAVPGGTHTDTLSRATPAMIATMLDMIRGSLAEQAAGGDDN